MLPQQPSMTLSSELHIWHKEGHLAWHGFYNLLQLKAKMLLGMGWLWHKDM